MKITKPKEDDTHRVWTKRLAKQNRTTRRRVLRYLQKEKRRVAKAE